VIETSTNARPMTPGRRGMVQGLVATTLLAHALAILFDIEEWPLSHYPMYSELREAWTGEANVLYGVVAAPEGDAPAEIPIEEPAALAPFGIDNLSVAFDRILRAPDRDTRLPEALANCLDRYEQARGAGVLRGPALRGMNLYRIKFPLTPSQARPPLLSRVLIAEHRR
jgi:hypothetical protein